MNEENMDANETKENEGGAADSGGESLDDQWSAALEEQESQEEAPEVDQGGSEQPAGAAGAETEAKEAEKPAPPAADFDRFQGQAPAQQSKASTPAEAAGLEMILDIPVTVSVEIGRTKIVVDNLLQLGQGSIIELEKLAGEPMEILVNGKLIARGEAVVINDKFGVKLTDIVSPSERITKLK